MTDDPNRLPPKMKCWFCRCSIPSGGQIYCLKCGEERKIELKENALKYCESLFEDDADDADDQ